MALPVLLLLVACAGDADDARPSGIGPGGGDVTSSDGIASVSIPPGALSQPTAIAVNVAANQPAGNVGSAYEFGPVGTNFAQPATIRISYDPAGLPAGVKGEDLVLAKVVSGQWQAVPGSSVSTDSAIVSGPASSFSVWGIIPLVPENLFAAPGEGRVTISWGEQFNASSYNLYWATHPGVTASDNKIANVVSPYVHGGLANGTPYYYRVSASTPAEGSLSASEVSATPVSVPVDVEATLGGLVGGNAPLTVVVSEEGVPLSGALVEFSASGGALIPSSGVTDASGSVTAAVMLDSGSPGLAVQVAVRRRPGGEVVGMAVAEARVGIGVPGCQVSGQSVEFAIDNRETMLYWAEDMRVDPASPATDQSLIKFLMNIPANQLPTGLLLARVGIRPISSAVLPIGGHVGTAFQIAPLEPPDLTGFTGVGQVPLTLAVRYDPAACWIPEDVEADLVLGRLNASGQWQAVCGTPASGTSAVREVDCSDGDLSFGVFGVVRSPRPPVDNQPPVFPSGTFSLTGRNRCDSCVPPWIEIEWGPANDGNGTGVLGYWIYVDGIRGVFTSDTTASPTVRYTLHSSGTVDTTREHFYQVQAVDNAGNVSALFGALRF